MRRNRRTASAKDGEKAEAVFERYKASGSDDIEPEGVERLCSDLGVDPADRQVLLMAWKMGAQRMGYFSREEFVSGMRALGCTDLAKLKKLLPVLEEAVFDDPDEYQAFYTFAFRYLLTEPRQKIIDVETAGQMLSVVMDEEREPLLRPFLDFLAQQKEYKTVNMDQWIGWLRFTQQIEPDFSNYSEDDGAWPLLLDNFVDWERKRGGAGVANGSAQPMES